MVRQCDRAIFEAQVEDERRNNNPPTFHGFAYSGEASDEDDPNDTYYYAEHMLFYASEKYPEEDEYREYITEGEC